MRTAPRVRGLPSLREPSGPKAYLLQLNTQGLQQLPNLQTARVSQANTGGRGRMRLSHLLHIDGTASVRVNGGEHLLDARLLLVVQYPRLCATTSVSSATWSGLRAASWASAVVRRAPLSW